MEHDTRTFAPLVEACKEHGISRTVAFELAASDKLETFAIGRRRYVKLESLRTLPERMKGERTIRYRSEPDAAA